jgi:heme o synthase
MALVVTTPRDFSAHRATVSLRRATTVVGALYIAALIATSLERFAVPGGDLEIRLQIYSVVALLAVEALAVAIWVTRRDDAIGLFAVTLAAILAPLRLVTSDVLQTLELRTLADVADLGLGLLALSCLVWFTAARPQTRSRTRSDEVFRHVTASTALLVFGLALSGATVRAVGASWACQGTFPDCNGLGPLPFGRDPLADVQLYHRLLSYVTFALVAWVAIETYRAHRHLLRLGLALVGAALAEGALGVASISSGNAAVTQALHTGGSALTLSAAVALTALAGTAPTTRNAERSTRNVALAYVQLTKPRVMSLLLATTATAMIIAARGLPDVGTFIATLLGGALMSGGAGAINHYVDRDIDPLMGRTAWRPIPSGVISPARALVFGILLAVLASCVFLVFVNPLACCLAVLGLLGYVFIYTLWLKRSTPSNIVIGGAAGAIPPLVGWAAVTNEITSLTAWYLFAIIFFWTPPHFWALSLLIRQHYERAGVPMLPVVRGEHETRKQIMLYSILLVCLTLVLSPFGMMGTIYFAAAVVLGGLFVGYAVRLWRRGTREAARRLYLYSILYLFALFCAMAVDRAVIV